MTLAELAPLLRQAYRENETIWIYAIQQGDDGPIKIGVTNSPAQRIKTLQQANPFPLKGLAAWRGFRCEERMIHEEFADFRLAGEWFEPAPELFELVLCLGCFFDDWT